MVVLNFVLMIKILSRKATIQSKVIAINDFNYMGTFEFSRLRWSCSQTSGLVWFWFLGFISVLLAAVYLHIIELTNFRV